MTDNQRFLVATGMRNEGPFIVEWVCWYRMLGFEILVATNDCTDHSVALLDALQDAGWLTHAPHIPREDQPPQKSALRKIANHPLTATVDWTLICDVDEFLVLHRHETIAELIGPPPHDYMAMVFNWKCFGHGEWDHYQDGLVHRQFRHCGMGHLRINRPIKVMLRNPTQWNRLGAHFPHGYRGDWAAQESRVVTPSGTTLPQFNDPANHPIRFLAQDQIDHKTAQMNHYIIRSKESYDHKRGIPSAAGFKDRYTDEFFNRYNRNGMRDLSAAWFQDRFAATHGLALKIPDVARLHHICCAEYVARMARKRGDDPDVDPRYLHHMAIANRVTANRNP
tara:strand:+ start:1971 stop:2981 length:1011 start_codon:yes stop_codon:yes gene_type:complete